MRNRWLFVVLAVSLFLNLAGFFAFAYIRYRRFKNRQLLFHRLKALAPEKVEPLILDYRVKMDSLKSEYWLARHKLARLSFEENPDPETVEKSLTKIGEIHKEMNRLVFETGRKTGMILPREHRERLRRHWCEIIKGPHPPPPGQRASPPSGPPR